MKNILIVDDEVEIVELLKVYFNNNSFKVYEAYDGKMALKIMESNIINVMIIDIMLPKIDGIQLVKKIRENSNIPIMFLSAKDDDIDKIYGLEIGADDYMTKPFNPLEVLVRVQALLRRVNDYDNNQEKKAGNVTIGELYINEESCEVFKNNIQLNMTSIEYKLLLYFMKNPNKVFTKQYLYETIWGDNYLNNENIIMVYISKIREKIEDDPRNPVYLKTIRGLGYRFQKVEK